jgi:hypothetical protein
MTEAASEADLSILRMRIAYVSLVLPETPSGWIRMPRHVKGFARRLFERRFGRKKAALPKGWAR